MLEKVMLSLKEELVKVKELIDRDRIYDISDEEKLDFEFGMHYMVIVENEYFYINLGSESFPDVDFDKIKYISKHRLIKNNTKYDKNSYIDTDVGEYTTEDDTQHDIDILTKFNVNIMNEIDTGCYD